MCEINEHVTFICIYIKPLNNNSNKIVDEKLLDK